MAGGDEPSPSATNDSELRTRYLDAVSHGARFALLSLSILALLFTTIEVHLREHDRKRETEIKRFSRSEKALSALRGKLAKDYIEIKEQLGRDRVLAAIVSELPVPAGSRPLPPSGSVLDNLRQRVDDWFEKQNQKIEKVPKTRKTTRKERDIRSAKAKKAKESASLIKTYLHHWGELSQALEDRNDAKTEIKRLESEKRSVPTPFGDFETDPRLGLLILALACSLTHLVFLATLHRVRQIPTIAAGTGSQSPIPPWAPAPFWIYPIRPELEGTRRTRWRLVAAIGLHVTWLVFTVVTILECDSLNATASIPLRHGDLAIYLLWLAASVQAVLAAMNFWELRPSFSITALRSRRRFLVAGAAAAAGVAAVILGGRPYQRSPKNKRSPKKVEFQHSSAKFLTAAELGDFVKCGRTGLLHHKEACGHHLDRIKASKAAPANSDAIHKANAHRTFELLADRSINEKNFDRAAELLKIGIEARPEAGHLYDKLVSLYGRQGCYYDIFVLLNTAKTQFEKQPKIQRRFTYRLELADKRKSRSAALRDKKV